MNIWNLDEERNLDERLEAIEMALGFVIIGCILLGIAMLFHFLSERLNNAFQVVETAPLSVRTETNHSEEVRGPRFEKKMAEEERRQVESE